jgi:hypothetical protein
LLGVHGHVGVCMQTAVLIVEVQLTSANAAIRIGGACQPTKGRSPSAGGGTRRAHQQQLWRRSISQPGVTAVTPAGKLIGSMTGLG